MQQLLHGSKSATNARFQVCNSYCTVPSHDMARVEKQFKGQYRKVAASKKHKLQYETTCIMKQTVQRHVL
jgi:hypothetical protein